MPVTEIMMLAVGLCFAAVAWGNFSNQLPATLTPGLFTSFHLPDLSETRGIKRSHNVQTSRGRSVWPRKDCAAGIVVFAGTGIFSFATVYIRHRDLLSFLFTGYRYLWLFLQGDGVEGRTLGLKLSIYKAMEARRLERSRGPYIF
jgi:hypothetical protein